MRSLDRRKRGITPRGTVPEGSINAARAPVALPASAARLASSLRLDVGLDPPNIHQPSIHQHMRALRGSIALSRALKDDVGNIPASCVLPETPAPESDVLYILLLAMAREVSSILGRRRSRRPGRGTGKNGSYRGRKEG